MAPRKQADSGDMVFVGCSLPNGLQLTVNGEHVILRGGRDAIIDGGYGITAVKRDFWEAWTAEFKSYPPLQKGLIFVSESRAAAEDESEEKAGDPQLKTGLEQLDPNAPSPGVKKVETEE